MKLKEVFDQLSYGELSQLSIGGSGSGVIEEDKYPALLTHINLGLASLYKRFLLKESSCLITLNPLITEYTISAQSGDPSEVFKIERIYTESGNELDLNVGRNPYSMTTLTVNKIKVPSIIAKQGPELHEWYKTPTLEVVFRANHGKLVVPGTGIYDPETVDLELPYQYLEALVYFIASRLHNPVGMTNEFGASNIFTSKYENECTRLEMQNLGLNRDNENDRLTRNGWV